VTENEKETYEDAADFFKALGYPIKSENEVTNNDIQDNSILVLSARNRIYRRLFADKPLLKAGFVIKVSRNPLNPAKVAVLLHARNRNQLESVFNRIFRYGNYSLLLFENGENTHKAISDSASGMVRDLSIRVGAIETKHTIGLENVIQKIKDKRVIFVGESHDEYAHHVIQHEIITRLYKLKGRLVIGMEMFQQPFQQYLNQYIQGSLCEEEFLKRTEYFTRWGFEYNLYRDILHFARANQIPVVALNLSKEIIDTVAENGIDALTEKAYGEVPHDIDMTNQAYREYMREVFFQHSDNFDKSFENFFQSQILWDETMAHNIAAALKKYPGVQIVVLAGNGHLQYSWGIPARVQRLTNETQTVILNSSGQEIDRSIADFVLFPAYIEVPQSPRLMVRLKQEPQGTVIEKLMPGGPAERAGLKENDLIIAINDKDIEDIADIKIILLNSKEGDNLQIKVRRKGFPFGTKVIVMRTQL
jgi:uncharacterized iron-regulated protein